MRIVLFNGPTHSYQPHNRVGPLRPNGQEMAQMAETLASSLDVIHFDRISGGGILGNSYICSDEPNDAEAGSWVIHSGEASDAEAGSWVIHSDEASDAAGGATITASEAPSSRRRG